MAISLRTRYELSFLTVDREWVGHLVIMQLRIQERERKKGHTRNTSNWI